MILPIRFWPMCHLGPRLQSATLYPWKLLPWTHEELPEPYATSSSPLKTLWACQRTLLSVFIRKLEIFNITLDASECLWRAGVFCAWPAQPLEGLQRADGLMAVHATTPIDSPPGACGTLDINPGTPLPPLQLSYFGRMMMTFDTVSLISCYSMCMSVWVKTSVALPAQKKRKAQFYWRIKLSRKKLSQIIDPIQFIRFETQVNQKAQLFV